MRMNKLGLTGIDVSLICLGTMTFGQQNTEDEGHAQMDYAVAQGVNFFDTAEMYAVPPSAETYGRTEEILGSWFAKTGRRKDIVLATKIAGPTPHMPWVRPGRDVFSAQDVAEACDASLKRLRTDYIDLYQIHWPRRAVNSFGKLDFDAAVTRREGDGILSLLQELAKLVKAGKVRHIGLSNETPWGVMTFLKHHAADASLPRVQSIQNAYNLLNRTFDIGLAEVALQEKVGLLAYSPLAGGTLTGKYLGGARPAGARRTIDSRVSRYARPLEQETVGGYVAIARKHGLDPALMANAFVNAQPHVTSNIIGATSLAQLKVNIDSAGHVLDKEVVAEINALHDRHPNPAP